MITTELDLTMDTQSLKRAKVDSEVNGMDLNGIQMEM